MLPIIKTARIGLLFFLTILFTAISSNSFAQAIRNDASNPGDNAAKTGPTTSVTPPGGMQPGDLVVMYGQYNAQGASMSVSQTSGQTWNTATTYSPVGSNQTIAIFWCTYNGTWGPDPSVTVGAGALALSNIMYVFSPSGGNKKWAVHNTATNTTSTGTTNTITGLATTLPNTVTMAFWSTSATNNTWGTLTSTGSVWSKTSLAAQYRNTTGTDQSHSAAYFIRTATGAAVDVSQNQSVAAATVLKTIMSWYELPANDECANAVTLTNATTSNTGSVWSATASSSIPVDCATGTPDDDVWYKFTPANPELNITLSSIGSNLAASGAKLQLFSGTCGSLTTLACGTTSLATTVVSGVPYYIRVYSAGAGSIGGVQAGSAFSITATATPTVTIAAGRNNEVFKQTTLSGSGVLQYPWEVTYGPDNNLWITESRGYKVYRMDPNTGVKTTVLDLTSASTDLSAWGADSLRAVNLSTWALEEQTLPGHRKISRTRHPVPQIFHPDSAFVYVSYVHRYLSTAAGSAGIFYRNKIVRFLYNSSTGKLGDPKVVCDTIPGGQDHNSQRMAIIARATPGGAYYLFYAAGDMGAGQFANRLRPQKAQIQSSYEGKILRFNLDNGGAGGWIPSDNPYSSSSAVWCVGMRNNQGFAYDSTLNILYGSSHGAYSDDEIDLIEKQRNYGHPYIIGYADGNYNGNPVQGTDSSVSAGAASTHNTGISNCPPIGDEVANIAVVNAMGNGTYKDPLFSAYAVPNGPQTTPGTIKYIWKNNPGNANPAPGWPSEAWSGLDLYCNSKIPGWKKSLDASSLKWGRLLRIKLGTPVMYNAEQSSHK